MPEFRNSGSAEGGDGVSDDLVAKAGRALGKIAQIEGLRERRGCKNRGRAAAAPERADQAATAVVSEEGLSVGSTAGPRGS